MDTYLKKLLCWFQAKSPFSNFAIMENNVFICCAYLVHYPFLCLFFSYCRCAIHSFILLCTFANSDNMFAVLVLVLPGKIASKYSTKVCKVFNI